MKKLHAAIALTALTLGVGGAAPALANVADDDLYKVQTDNAPARHTVCNQIFGNYTTRAAVVRGKTANVRIQRNLVDVNLERASVESCSGNCTATIRRKGGAPNKGFADIDLKVETDAPTGNATLVLHYFGGGRGEYPLLIVRNSRVDNVAVTSSAAGESRITFTGNNLHLLGSTPQSTAPADSGKFRRISEADETLVFNYAREACNPRSMDLTLPVEASGKCSVQDVRFTLPANASCQAASAPSTPPATQTPPPPPQPPAQQPVRLNLTPALVTPTPFFRSINPTLPDAGALRRQVAQSFCAGFANDEERSINLQAIRWGINYANLPAASAVSAEIVNANTGAVLQRQTAAPITQGNGTDVRLFDNWASRPAAVKVVFAFSETKRNALGARPVAGGAPSPVGCYLAASEPLTRFDPPRITVRVNTATPAAAETQTNDNEITL